ncbi:unnamed protein product [Arabidopsis lyrata]|nr:unnamed protein product [Arabidopsis lyrata]
MEETKGQTQELRPSGLGGRSDERTGRRHGKEPEKMEKEDLSFGISEEGEIPDQQESDAFSDARYYLRQQQRVSNVEMQRRSHETESRLWQRARTPDSRGSGSTMMLEERTQGRSEPVLSAYPIRPGEENCPFYLKNHLCGWGSDCCYNHPPLHEIPYRIGNKLDCKFFKAGSCKRGSNCQFYHPRDGAEPMRQGRTPDLRRNDSGRRRYKTEARSWPEKREKEDSGFRRNEVGQFRDHQDSDEDSQEILLQQRPRDVEMRKRSRSPGWRASSSRETFENTCQRRHGKELALSKRARDLQKPRQRNMERQRREAQENLQQQWFQEQRKRNIEKARIEARLKLDQMRRTVVFDEYDRASKMMRELGFTYLTGSFLGRQEMEKWIFRSR